jgi:hypothetical protein
MEFSTRSQASFRREQELKEEIGKIENQRRYSERKLAELETAKERLSKSVLAGDTAMHGALALTLREIEDEQRKVKVFEELIGGLRKQIAQIQESVAAGRQRRIEGLKAVGKLAITRTESDLAIERLLADLRRGLQERAETSRKMQEAGKEIELSTDWDTERYDQLLAILPETMLPASERWSAKFLGKREGTKEYVVRVDQLLLPETLAHSGVYFFGDIVRLLDDEARELLRENVRAPRSNAPWGVAPAKIMPLGDFQEAEKASKAAGISVREFILWHDVECNKRSKAAYESSPWGIQGLQPYEHSEITVSVKVKAKGNINRSGKEYRPGDVFAVENDLEFWQLADSQAIALPA